MKYWFFCFFTLILVSCAKPSLNTPAPQEQAVENFRHWNLEGRAAIKSGKEGGTVNVKWQQNGTENYHITMYGTLGQGRTEIMAKGEHVELKTLEGTRLVSSNAEVLLGEYTGWYLPVEHLFYWVRGLPAPGAVEIFGVNEEGHLASFQQDGWIIQYQEYMSVDNLILPRRMTLSHPGNTEDPPLNVKWLSKSWE